MKCPDPEWYVYVDNCNRRTIETFNVFKSYKFLNGCRKAFKRYKNPEQIEELKNEIKNLAMYCFWSKCEYEVIITGFVSRTNEKKIDVFNQLLLNWDSFFEYVYAHKAYFLRREKADK